MSYQDGIDRKQIESSYSSITKVRLESPITYTHHNSKFRLSKNILGPYLEVVIEANRKQYAKYCEDLPTEQLSKMAEYAFIKREFSFVMGIRWWHEVTVL